MNTFLQAAQHYAVDLGWAVLPLLPGAKEPLTTHGVKDATTDERTIVQWWDRWPEANVGLATGAPNPTVLDVDKPQLAPPLVAELEALGAPESATYRGKHLILAGEDRATIKLTYGELRGLGSYVVVPPSIHPSGKTYVWLTEPRSRRLPPVPSELLDQAQPAGVGILPERQGKVPHGERHDYLKDMAVRYLRAGILDADEIEEKLRGDYERHCEHHPPARADEFRKHAEWAARDSKIAARERNRREHRDQDPGAGWMEPPKVNAPLEEHRAYVHRLAGLAANVEVREVHRFGTRTADGMQVHLSTGATIDFARQSEATARGGWHKAVIAATNGAADPPGMKEPQLLALYKSLCLIANTQRHVTEIETHTETLREFLGVCELVLGHTLTAGADRFRLIEALRARERYDPFDRNSLARPALIVDSADEVRYVRGGELWDFVRLKGGGLSARDFPGRMAMAGLEQLPINGREPMPLDPSRGRRKAHAVLYRLAEVPE